MSCSNIGARNGRNIRDHLFVINAILHDVIANSKINIDLEIYDNAYMQSKVDTKKLELGVTNVLKCILATTS